MSASGGARPEMRLAFADELVALGAADPRVVVLDNDVGLTSLSERFRETYPQRYLDLGIAEKNLFGTAAGLAAGGLVAFPVTFAVFATRCALDQVSISIAYPALDVKISGHYVGGSRAGASHIAIEDLAVYRALPNMRVADPADDMDLRAVMRTSLATPGPAYFRVAKLAVPELFGPAHRFEWGKGLILRSGSDVSLFGTGVMTHMCLEAARLLEAEGIDAEVVHMASIKPIDAELIGGSVARTGAAVAAELASINGGFGSAVAEVLGERCPAPLRRIGYRDRWVHSAPIEDLLDEHHLRPADIASAAREALAAKRDGRVGTRA